MADPATRLLRLLGLLQRRAEWSGTELADRLAVDARTLRRDVERLRDLGYHVQGNPGVGGGYRLAGGTDVPPLLFEDDEALAVAIVLGVSATTAVAGIEQSALAALAKLDRLLPPRLRAQLTTMRAATVSLVEPTEAVSAEGLIRLAEACDRRLLATFAYRSQDGRRTERRVEPHRLVATDRRWYLVAYDLDRADWRTFRVDRASSVALPGHIFKPRPLDDPARLVAQAITTAPYAHEAVVRITAPVEEVDHLIDPHVGVLEPDGAHTMVRLGVDDFDWLAGYLIRLGVDFEVVAPAAARARLVELGERLRTAHV